MRFVDPSGLWTFALGADASAALGLRLGVNGAFVVDDKGNVGIVLGAAIGGGTPAASVGGTVTVTTADNIFHLRGASAVGGGSWVVGADVTIGQAKREDGEKYNIFGIVLGAGLSIPLPEAHGELAGTAVISLNWLPLWIKNEIMDTIKGYYDLLTCVQREALKSMGIPDSIL